MDEPCPAHVYTHIYIIDSILAWQPRSPFEMTEGTRDGGTRPTWQSIQLGISWTTVGRGHVMQGMGAAGTVDRLLSACTNTNTSYVPMKYFVLRTNTPYRTARFLCRCHRWTKSKAQLSAGLSLDAPSLTLIYEVYLVASAPRHHHQPPRHHHHHHHPPPSPPLHQTRQAPLDPP